MGLTKGTSFFGAMDRRDKRPDGKPSASFPAWYFENHIERLRRRISNMKAILNNPNALPDAKQFARNEVISAKAMIAEILKGKPNFKEMGAKSKDYLWNFYKWSGAVISEDMPTVSQMKGGAMGKWVFDANEHLKRENAKRINITKYADIARACDRQIVKDCVNIKDLQVMWKIVGRLLDEATNVEVLRRDEVGVVGYKDRPLYEVDAQADLSAGLKPKDGE